MKDRRQRNIIIGTLCCLLVFMGIGYAILSTNLNILGKSTFVGSWNIVMTNISVVSEGQATGTYSDLSTDNQNATLSVDLYKPMDKVTYTVTVENQGTIDASLKAVNLLPVSNHEYVEAITTAKVGTALLAGDSTTFDVTIRFKNVDITSLPSDVTVQYDLSLTFMQYTENTFVKGETLSDNSSFMISKRGIIIDYDWESDNNSNYVTLPASIDGINITGLSGSAFEQGNVLMYYRDSGATLVSGGSAASTGFIIKDEENFEAIKSYCIEVYGTSDSDTGEVYGFYHVGEVVVDNTPLYGKLNIDIQNNKSIDTVKPTIEYLNLSQTNITAIDNYAFKDYTSLKEVIFPRNLQSIGDYSFERTSLEELFLPDTVVSIGTGAFEETNIKRAYIPSGVDKISAFYNAPLKELKIGAKIIAESYSLDKLTLLDSVISIKNAVFANGQIDKLIIPSGITDIVPGTFSNNKINTLTLNSGLQKVGGFDSNQLTNVNLPNTVTTIYNNAFKNNQITSVNLGNSVTSIGDYAFFENLLTKVIIPSTVTQIGSYAFSYNSLTEVVIPSSVTKIGSYAFNFNPNLTKITFRGRTSTDGITLGQNWCNSTVEIVFEEN